MANYQRKTRDIYEIHTDYGYGDGYEYSTAEFTPAEAKKTLREYQKNQPQYMHKIVKKREKIKTEGINA